jgi:hypothetical protein
MTFSKNHTIIFKKKEKNVKFSIKLQNTNFTSVYKLTQKAIIIHFKRIFYNLCLTKTYKFTK